MMYVMRDYHVVNKLTSYVVYNMLYFIDCKYYVVKSQQIMCNMVGVEGGLGYFFIFSTFSFIFIFFIFIFYFLSFFLPSLIV
jgi:hypothetical protein